MKLLMAVICLLSVTITAHAEVVKPTNTIEAAKGKVEINGLPIEYSVVDRGWHVHSKVTADTYTMEASKSFMFEYPTGNKIAEIDAANAAAMMGADAAGKCNELGQLEYKEQVKAIAPGSKSEVLSNIRNAKVFVDDEIRGVFICAIQINVTK